MLKDIERCPLCRHDCGFYSEEQDEYAKCLKYGKYVNGHCGEFEPVSDKTIETTESSLQLALGILDKATDYDEPVPLEDVVKLNSSIGWALYTIQKLDAERRNAHDKAGKTESD